MDPIDPYAFQFSLGIHLRVACGNNILASPLWFTCNSSLLDKLTAFSQTMYSGAFSWMKILHVEWNFTEVSTYVSNWQWPSIALDNGFVPNRRQAIIWADAWTINWLIHVAHGEIWVNSNGVDILAFLSSICQLVQMSTSTLSLMCNLKLRWDYIKQLANICSNVRNGGDYML